MQKRLKKRNKGERHNVVVPALRHRHRQRLFGSSPVSVDKEGLLSIREGTKDPNIFDILGAGGSIPQNRDAPMTDQGLGYTRAELSATTKE